MPHPQVLHDAQEFLVREEIPGWLIYDYRQSNPIFRQVVTPSGHVTRPCFLYIPAASAPQLLVHYVDAGKFLECGLELLVYSNRQGMLQALKLLLSGAPTVAMEYSPQNALPRVSRVDAGTVELVRSLGVEVMSSAEVMQYATQRWSAEQLAGHQRAAEKLGRIVNQAFRHIGDTLVQQPDEFAIAEFIRRRFREEGLVTADGPIVATNAHSADPHYEPAAQGSSLIQPDDWVLIDLWAREDTPGSVYADITWVAYVGDQASAKHLEIFNVVTGARDAALQYLQEAHRQGTPVQGWQADAVARDYITQRRYGAYFTHRLGHSISYEVHGEAVNLDGYETHDTRTIIPGIGFSIEPGIYLPEFGVRSEIDCYMSDDGPYASSPVQREIVLIQGNSGALRNCLK
ncbi:MAG: M24 family metallopeptidase [Dehalococcoidia bacterium]|nr:M24 family metallopeptidase [Dehalococcoidia bacterium]MSQ17282.1 M24 family metallopeptidase [Dehalococcoidia bacterium]